MCDLARNRARFAFGVVVFIGLWGWPEKAFTVLFLAGLGLAKGVSLFRSGGARTGGREGRKEAAAVAAARCAATRCGQGV